MTSTKYLLVSDLPSPSWGTVLLDGERLVVSEWLPGSPPSAVTARLVDASVRPVTGRQAKEIRLKAAPPEGYVPKNALWGWQIIDDWSLLSVLPLFGQNEAEAVDDECWIPYRAATATGWWRLTSENRKSMSRALYIECHTNRLDLFLFSEHGLVWLDGDRYQRQIFPGSNPSNYPRLVLEQIEPVWLSLLERGRITPDQIQWMSLAVTMDTETRTRPSESTLQWRSFLEGWFRDSFQAFFSTEPVPVHSLPIENYIVNAEGLGCPHLPVALWEAAHQLSSGVGLDLRQKLSPFPKDELTAAERFRQWWQASLLARVSANQVVTISTLTAMFLASWLGIQWWQLQRFESKLALRAATARQRQVDLARVQQEIAAIRNRNRALQTLRDVLEKEIPHQMLISDSLTRLENNYVPGVVVRRYRSDGETLLLEGLIRQNMLAAGERPADLVGRFVAHFEASPDVLSVSPTIKEVLDGDSPFEIKVQMKNATKSVSVSLPPLSEMIATVAEQKEPTKEPTADRVE